MTELIRNLINQNTVVCFRVGISLAFMVMSVICFSQANQCAGKPYDVNLKKVWIYTQDSSDFIQLTDEIRLRNKVDFKRFTGPQFAIVSSHNINKKEKKDSIVSHPVAFVSGGRLRVKAMFESKTKRRLFIRARIVLNPNDTSWLPSQEVIARDNRLIYDWRDMDRVFQESKILYVPTFLIRWEGSNDNLKWSKIDESFNALYVTYKRPSDKLKEISHTQMHISCIASSKLSPVPDSLEHIIVEEIFTNAFMNRNNKFPGIRRKADNMLLTYYKHKEPSDDCASSAKDLLKTSDGRCTAWADFFIETVRIQGIEDISKVLVHFNARNARATPKEKTRAIDILKNKVKDSKRISVSNKYYFLIKNWGDLKVWSMILIPCDVQYPEREQDFDSATWASGQNGIMGQGGVMNPRSIFDSHVFTKYGNRIYDPSYGIKSDWDNIEDFESRCLAATKGLILSVERRTGDTEFYFCVLGVNSPDQDLHYRQYQ